MAARLIPQPSPGQELALGAVRLGGDLARIGANDLQAPVLQRVILTGLIDFGQIVVEESILPGSWQTSPRFKRPEYALEVERRPGTWPRSRRMSVELGKPVGSR